DPYANLYTASILPLSGTAYARVWVYLATGSYPTAFNQVINFANAGGAGTAFATQNDFPILNDYATPLSYAESTSTTLPRDRWICLALSIAQGSATGPVKLFVNDAEVTDVTFNNAPTPSMTHIYVGLDWVGNPASFPATDIWLDELVIND